MSSHDYTRRDFLKTISAGAMSLAMTGCTNFASRSKHTQANNKPNIIFIMADDLGYGDFSCYGATKVQTPNVDRLAEQGVRFTDAHTPSAVCSPTRYGVLTGRYCWRSRLKRWVLTVSAPLLIETERMTVPSLLKSAGYTTGCVGKWHLGFGKDKTDWNAELKPGPLEVGFDYYFGVPTSNNWPPFVYVGNHHVVGRRKGEIIEIELEDDWAPKEICGIAAKRKDEEIAITQTAKAVDFIHRNKDRPFFLYFPTCNIHLPHRPNHRFRGTSSAGAYGDFIHEFDWTVGEVLKTLDRLNLTDNTLIIVTSDNGGKLSGGHSGKLSKALSYGHRPCGELRGQKADIYEGGHRVPFIARWPGKIKSGSECDEIICLTDLMATCAAIVGSELPNDAGEDSYNILPALLGEKRDRPVREATVHHSSSGMFAIRQGRWKLIEGLGSGGLSRPKSVKPIRGLPQGQLYDLHNDPAETNNLWDRHPEVVERLEALLQKYRKQGRSRPI